MRLIKLFVISVVVLFAIITGLGLLLPSAVRVTRNITIHAPQDTVYRYISDVKYWKFWLEGAKANPVQFLSKRTAGIGTVALLNGQQISIEMASKEWVETVWKTSKGKMQKGIFQIQPVASAGGTNVNWYFEQKVAWYPWERLSTLSNDKLMGPGMEQSLDNLRAIFE